MNLKCYLFASSISANKTAGTHGKGELTIILWTISNVAKTASAEGS